MAIKYGLTFDDFWNMTIKEINIFIKAIQERERDKYSNTYLQASLTANFVGFIINGKQIPPIHSVFPELYEDEARIAQAKQDYLAQMLYKEQMLDWAMAVNKRNQAKKEGETN